jgi:hypothetical protein
MILLSNEFSANRRRVNSGGGKILFRRLLLNKPVFILKFSKNKTAGQSVLRLARLPEKSRHLDLIGAAITVPGKRCVYYTI